MKILFLAQLFPLPLDSGGKIKSFHTLRGLAAAHEVHLLAFVRTQEERDLVGELRGVAASVETVPFERSPAQKLIEAVSSIVRNQSFIVSRDFRPAMASAFAAAMERLRPDVVHIDHLQMAQYVPPDLEAVTVLDQHNVEHAIIRRLSENSDSSAVRLFSQIEWPKLRDSELAACRRADLVVTVSDEDAVTLQTLDPSLTHMRSAPIGVDTEYFRPIQHDPNSRNLLSIGTMHWPPNVDSILYFHRDVFPRIQWEMPECTLTIVGQQPVQSILNLQSDPAVRVTGYVKDVREEARNCGVFIVPLRAGSGVRVKILNALAMALPVVSTSIGVEGIEVEHGKHLLIADTPGEFARRVIDLLRDPEMAEAIGAAGCELVESRYSWKVVGRQWREIYHELAERKSIA